MKLIIWIGITTGGLLGSWLGSILDHGNFFGSWSIFGGAIGSFVGLWVGFKLGKAYFE